MAPLTEYLKRQIYLFALNQKYFIWKQKLRFIFVAKKQTHCIVCPLAFFFFPITGVHRNGNRPIEFQFYRERKDQIMNQELRSKIIKKPKDSFPKKLLRNTT